MPDISDANFPDTLPVDAPIVDEPDRVALIIFTGGTSGTPKGCVRTVGELLRTLLLDGILDLSQLGLSDWPYTVVGKLSIFELRRLVEKQVDGSNF
jgi:acyl-CoA synthetase (AMP-forming)/AMP-acid ligase II